jgi:chromosome partitioning protein
MTTELDEEHRVIDPLVEAPRARIIALANQKGGVGKTTTAVNLAACLADAGERVLLVDMDPQGNASTGLGIEVARRRVTIYDVIASSRRISEAMIQTEMPGLWVVPSTMDLAGAEVELVGEASRESRLARVLDDVRGGFDFVVLDCPPSVGMLTINALAAADELIVPIQCEYYALEGLGHVLRNIRLIQQNVNPNLRLAGIVLTMFDSRTRLAEQVAQEIRTYFGSQVYDTVIPRSVRVAEAPGYGVPIIRYDPTSNGAKAYRMLATEVMGKREVTPPPPQVVARLQPPEGMADTVAVAGEPGPGAVEVREGEVSAREFGQVPERADGEGDMSFVGANTRGLRWPFGRKRGG